MTVEKYEIIGTEENVSEWWKLADKAAQETNCTLSEDFGGSHVGDIVQAVKILQRYSAYANINDEGTKPVMLIKSEGIFLSIPGSITEESGESEYMTWKILAKEYSGIRFEYMSEWAAKEQRREWEGAA